MGFKTLLPNFTPFCRQQSWEKVAYKEKISLGAPFICRNFLSKQENPLWTLNLLWGRGGGVQCLQDNWGSQIPSGRWNVLWMQHTRLTRVVPARVSSPLFDLTCGAVRVWWGLMGRWEGLMPWSGAAELLASCLQSKDLRVVEGRDLETCGVPDAAREGVLITDLCLPACGSKG